MSGGESGVSRGDEEGESSEELVTGHTVRDRPSLPVFSQPASGVERANAPGLSSAAASLDDWSPGGGAVALPPIRSHEEIYAEVQEGVRRIVARTHDANAKYRAMMSEGVRYRLRLGGFIPEDEAPTPPPAEPATVIEQQPEHGSPERPHDQQESTSASPEGMQQASARSGRSSSLAEHEESDQDIAGLQDATQTDSARWRVPLPPLLPDTPTQTTGDAAHGATSSASTTISSTEVGRVQAPNRQEAPQWIRRRQSAFWAHPLCIRYRTRGSYCHFHQP